MNSTDPEYISEISKIGNFYWGYTLQTWEFAYYVSQITGAVLVLLGLAAAVANLRMARKNIDHLEQTNRDNNDLQRKYILQSRLIDLSHQWNSQEFVTARNWAALILEEYRDKEDVDIQKALITREKASEWIYISMVAHFFLRLSHIQVSNQVDLKNAQLEFKEAIEYWLRPLLRAYRYDKTEGRLRSALIELHNTYNPDKLYVS